MSSGPTDDELRNKAEDRRDEMNRTADNLNDLADDIDDAADLASSARDYDARLTGLFGATLDSDVDTFQYTADALGNFRSVVGDHIANLTGLHDKVDRNRREFLAVTGGAALLGADYINIREDDSDFSGHFNEGPTEYGKNDIDGFGLVGDQPENSVSGTDSELVEASISDVEGLGNYLEDLSDRDLQEWSALWSQYDESSAEFFPDQDISLQGIDIVYNEDRGKNSGYRTNAEISGEEQYSDWQWFEHDETAQDALEHFGEI
jgi:hypothetical protein